MPQNLYRLNLEYDFIHQLLEIAVLDIAFAILISFLHYSR